MLKNQATLYKFRDWNNQYNRKMVIDGELYFANNYSLNDPFDLLLPNLRTPIPLNLQDVEKLTNRKLTEEEVQHVKKLHSEGKIEVPSSHWEEIENLNTLIKNHEENHGVYCLTGDPKNILMWGHYANSHHGLCIGFDTEELSNYIKTVFNIEPPIKRVNYEKEIPVYKHGSNQKEILSYLELRTITKFEDWRYENEYRIVLENMANKPLIIPKQVFTEIIFGFNMDQTRRKELRIICEKIYPNMKYFEAIKSSTKFEMEIVPIDKKLITP